ncbi:hypothetical protein ACFOSC_05950 [Streptantibioticus rubrisoli]|uniref:Uncharacterized protein n=1 Tax=Streptantibioticus rubrisoli TaxID=1387313 RepID=A0ABT1PDJ6_9ACTN|nr:hypothetical protein [Streptantibioticus rubrisoli]MCQ4043442.1 hypothetical protein [Streptantibioticus rubrisoli]
MDWILLTTALAFCGIAVLGVLGIRVYVEVRRLARQVGDSSQALASAAEQFQRSAEPLAARAGDMVRH